MNYFIGLSLAYLSLGALGLLLSRLYALTKNGAMANWPAIKGELSALDAVSIAALWPFFVVLLLIDSLATRLRIFLHGSDPSGLCCQRMHLLRKVSVQDALAASTVVDPLGRVPPLPFGHLNKNWQSFLDSKQPGWQLWQFEVPGVVSGSRRSNQPQWALPRGRKAGYVWATRWKRVEREFVTEWD